MGNAASLGMASIVLVFSLVLRWYLGHLNEQKRRAQNSEQAALDRPKGFEELGDKHPGTFQTSLRPSHLLVLLVS